MNTAFTPDTQTFMEGIPYPAMILNRSLRIVTMNRLMEAMTGYPSDRVTGLLGELVVRSNTGNNRGQLYRNVLKSGETMSVPGDVLNRFRRKISILYNISALYSKSGAGIGLLVIAEDISAREELNKKRGVDFSSAELIGYSPKMQKVFDMIPLMAQTDASVLITGETGTGKDKIAELIHQKSGRARFPFIKVNCGALPLGLLESELFGHVKGSFTGASRNKPGMFKLADRGTLFLTEIGDMPLPLQVKLLSVLDDRRFIPVGGEKSETVDVRIIAATHRPLRKQVMNNKFREDLFYRLNVLHLHLPPLRERESDIRYLLDHFLEKKSRALGKSILGFTPSAMQVLIQYAYPGNVRELINIVEYSVNLCRRKKITKELLPHYLFEKQPEEDQAFEEGFGAESADDEILRKGNGRLPEKGGDRGSWEDIERQMIVDVLKKHRGSRHISAEELGWGRMRLWRKMKKYGLLH